MVIKILLNSYEIGMTVEIVLVKWIAQIELSIRHLGLPYNYPIYIKASSFI